MEVTCSNCLGFGRVPGDEGVYDCPDCGGAGTVEVKDEAPPEDPGDALRREAK